MEIGILAHLLNMSLDGAFVPSQWKTAVIRPKAKVVAPKTPADYRLILVLPIKPQVVIFLVFGWLEKIYGWLFG